MTSSFGILLALGALVLWGLSPFFFTATGKIIGPFATNLLRLGLAFPVLLLCCAGWYALYGAAGMPSGFPALLLAASGALGLGLGDLFLYRSFFRIGPEKTSLLITLAPAITVILAWSILGETLSSAQLLGMVLILGGVTGVVWRRNAGGGWRGAWDGAGAALCQGFGAVMAREAFLRDPGLSPLYATTLRIGTAALSILLVAAARGALREAALGLKNAYVRNRLIGGTLAGPLGGMTFYVAAMKYQPAGIVTTITFMTPLIVVPLGAWHYGTRVGKRLALAVLAALAGVILLGWNP